jgi:hypothetical protein
VHGKWVREAQQGEPEMPEGPPLLVALPVVFVRRRPTLPPPCGGSTIGAGRLNFRVRDGSGCFPVAVAAVTLVPRVVGVGFCVVWVVWCWVVDARHLQLLLVLLVCGCGTSPRPISTGRLDIAVVDLRPINPMVCGGPYQVCPVGNFILKCASRLDAFSGYHVRT